ncbi:hypothetical protein F183_A34700 [Bryobacterales bacterium F-183]|nr:hypothetical protein F183_A34700 [Bryobacterales bacterium F-183]
MANFPSTRRSILEAAQSDILELRQQAAESIAEAYWKPAYKYIRLKWNANIDDAEDLAQGFFTSVVERGLIGKYDPSKAAFRTYLRTCIDGYIQNHRKAATRLKRGGNFNFAEAEHEIADTADSAEDIFHREWQRHMFSLAISDLRRQNTNPTRLAVFERYDLAPDVNQRPTYDDIARELNIPVTTVTNHLSAARRELKRCLLARLSGITSSDSELRREAEYLLS